jgi:hypothetical protein
VACIQDLQCGAIQCQLVRPRFAYMSPFPKRSKAAEDAFRYLAMTLD